MYNKHKSETCKKQQLIMALKTMSYIARGTDENTQLRHCKRLGKKWMMNMKRQRIHKSLMKNYDIPISHTIILYKCINGSK